MINSFNHVFDPCRPFLVPNPEAKMRFPEASPPTALRILARAFEELDQEGSEFLDGAVQSLSGKKRTKQRIPTHTGIKGDREPAPRRRAANSLMQAGAINARVRGRSRELLSHTTNSLAVEMKRQKFETCPDWGGPKITIHGYRPVVIVLPFSI